MYQEFYGLDADPFRLSPDHGYCLRHPTFQKAKAYMQFAAHRAEGFVMITGRPGTGKTTLIEDVLSEIEGKDVLAAKLVSAQLEAEDLLRMTAFNFGIPAKDVAKADLLMEMQGFFADQLAQGQRPLLVIDEAQGLSLNALEELRLLTNLRIDGQPMLQIFLVGQDELRDLVLDPKMEQLHQRMVAACHLEPLDFNQTAAYTMHRLKVSGWEGNPRIRAPIFPPLHRFSQGIPRRINLFMGRLLLHGWLEEKTELGGPEAETVLAELKSEHLAPTQNPGLFNPNQPIPSHEEIDPALLMPDQKIGAKLMQKENVPRPNPPAGANPAQPAGPAEVPAPPDTLTGSAENPRPDDDPGTTQTFAEGDCPHKRGKELLIGLAFSVLAALLLTFLVLLISPIPTAGTSTNDLLRSTGLIHLRARLHNWTGGRLPLFTPPPPPRDENA